MTEKWATKAIPPRYWALDTILESVRELLAALALDAAEGIVLDPLQSGEADNLEWEIRVVQGVIEEMCKDGEERCWPDVVNRIEERAREMTEGDEDDLKPCETVEDYIEALKDRPDGSLIHVTKHLLDILSRGVHSND